MFALSVLNFISQLYLPPPDMMKQLSDWAGKFARGPRFWLCGAGGHALFRAGPDISLKSVPRCPVSACKALCLNTTHKFLGDHVGKLDLLREAADVGNSTLAEVACIIYTSPPMNSKQLVEEASQLGYQRKIRKASIKTDVNKIAYNMFHTNVHPANSLQH